MGKPNLSNEFAGLIQNCNICGIKQNQSGLKSTIAQLIKALGGNGQDINTSLAEFVCSLNSHIQDLNNKAYFDQKTGAGNWNLYEELFKVMQSEFQNNGKNFTLGCFKILASDKIKNEYGPALYEDLLKHTIVYLKTLLPKGFHILRLDNDILGIIAQTNKDAIYEKVEEFRIRLKDDLVFSFCLKNNHKKHSIKPLITGAVGEGKIDDDPLKLFHKTIKAMQHSITNGNNTTGIAF